MNRHFVPVVLIAGVFLSPFSHLAMAAPVPKTQRTVTVQGEASVSLKPDLAVVTLGAVSRSPQAASALEANNQTMRRLFEAIRAFGISDRNFRTSEFSVNPQYESGRGRKLVGYTVRNKLTVKLRDLSRAGEFISNMAAQGANQFHGLRFEVEKTRNRMDNLRKAAFKDAERRARILAESAGLKLGRAIQITEGKMLGPGPRLMYSARTTDLSTPIATGESVMRMTVTAVFEIE